MDTPEIRACTFSWPFARPSMLRALIPFSAPGRRESPTPPPSVWDRAMAARLESRRRRAFPTAGRRTSPSRVMTQEAPTATAPNPPGGTKPAVCAPTTTAWGRPRARRPAPWPTPRPPPPLTVAAIVVAAIRPLM
uniref:Uncharacterized protein n=1 Tax=Setaria viridis TaxID=4556 RepID=A0A4U6V639_SETVI|nr:hypothetical protein SEVIR_3G060650v2 [Setaria viridis]